jgi:DNA (cytosine-5)-methyltransferase 1
MKILNLHSGIGGNRRLWGSEHEVTAVEYDPAIAAIYKDFFPEDEVVVADAHEYLLENHKNFDFIWSSPPCQTHSSFRHNINVRFRGTKPAYPDMKLYQEIIFLQHNSEALWLVENVIPYYEPLIAGKKINRHLYWSNFEIPNLPKVNEKIRSNQIPGLQELHGFDLSKYKLSNKRQILRNCVYPETGLEILKIVERIKQ